MAELGLLAGLSILVLIAYILVLIYTKHRRRNDRDKLFDKFLDKL